MGVSDGAWALLLAAGFERRHEPGQVLMRQGDGEELRAELATLTAGPRLARTLLQFVPKGFEPPADVALSQSELGRAAGLSRSSVAAQQARLRKQGVIDTGRGHVVVLDLVRLRAAAGETGRNV